MAGFYTEYGVNMAEKKRTTVKLSLDVLEYVDGYQQEHEIDSRQETVDELLRDHMEGRVVTGEKGRRRMALDVLFSFFQIGFAVWLGFLVADLVNVSAAIPWFPVVFAIATVMLTALMLVEIMLFIDLSLWVIGAKADQAGGWLPALENEFPRLRALLTVAGRGS